MLMTSAGILQSYRCEARTGRKQLVGMQPGRNSLLLPPLKRICPAASLFLVRAEEEPTCTAQICAWGQDLGEFTFSGSSLPSA